jgi:hypothetical protein
MVNPMGLERRGLGDASTPATSADQSKPWFSIRAYLRSFAVQVLNSSGQTHETDP